MAEEEAAVQDDSQRSPIASFGLLPDLLGFHLRLAFVAIVRDYAKSMEETKLTQQQHAVLLLIDENPGISQVDVAEILGTDRVTMIAMIDKLEIRKLIKRKRSKSDRRRQELHIQPAGKALLEVAARIIAEHESRFTARFGPDELGGLFAALRKIHERDF